MSNLNPNRLSQKQAEWRSEAVKLLITHSVLMLLASLFASYLIFNMLASSNPQDLREGARWMADSYWGIVCITLPFLLLFAVIVTRMTAGPYPTQQALDKDDAITLIVKSIVDNDAQNPKY